MRKLFVILLVAVLISGCGDFFETWSFVRIENHSGKVVWACGVLPSRDEYGEWILLDVDGREVKFFVADGNFKRILSDENRVHVYITEKKPAERINPSMTESEIMQKFSVIQKYELTRDDWLNLKCITYPPTEKMARVQMWPPYEKSVEQGENK